MQYLERVETYNQIDSGDILLYINLENASEVYKLKVSDWMPVVLKVIQEWIVESVPVTLTLAEYDSPLRQLVLKKITIK